MPQLVKKRRSGWAVLAVGALVASLFAVGAGSAAADEVGDDDGEAEVDYEASATACLGDALDDRMFSDVSEDSDHRDAINCLAHYGITVGKGDGTFAPSENVRASQMTAFMTRTANLVGADPEDVLEGVMMSDPVTRADMAVLISNLLVASSGNEVKRDSSGQVTINDNPSSGFDYFADARSGVPRYQDEAISSLYELGVAAGKTDDSFVPGDNVTRAQMASFITRALGHTNARPAGLTAQVAGAQITVSIRDDNHAPVVNAAVDAFKAAVADEAKAFKDDGGCSSRTSTVDGAQKCEIDGADPATQSDGNITLVTLQGEVGDGQTVWIWTGDLGDKVGSDTDLFEVPVEKGAEDLPAAASATITSDLAKQPGVSPPADVTRAHFGTTVTYTIQLQGDPDTDPDNDNNVNVGPPDGDPTTYTVVTMVSAPTTEGDLALLAQSTATVTIGSDGSATFTATAADPDPDNSGNTITVAYIVMGGIAPGVTLSGGVVFSDEASVVTHVTVEVGGAQVAPGDDDAGNAATVTVLDQFGKPFRGASVVLNSNNPTGVNDALGSTIRTTALLTGSNGTVRIGYSYSGGASEETLEARASGGPAEVVRTLTGTVDENNVFSTTDRRADSACIAADAATNPNTYEFEGALRHVDDDDDAETPDNNDDNDANETDASRERDVFHGRCGSTEVYWVMPTEDEDSTGLPVVLSLDADNDQVVVDLGSGGVTMPTSVNYDGNDYYTIVTRNAANTADVETPSTLEDFETKLAKALEDKIDAKLEWKSYIYDDPSDIASFTLDVTGD